MKEEEKNGEENVEEGEEREEERRGEASLCLSLEFSKQLQVRLQDTLLQEASLQLQPGDLPARFEIASCQDGLNQFLQIEEQGEKFQMEDTDQRQIFTVK